jgi:putative addiction module component (TIGR02574 family)
MTAKAHRLLHEALELPPKARGDLAASLIDSLDDAADPSAEKAWAAEVDRRLDALDSGKAKTVPWSQVEKGLLKSGRASKHR